MKLFKRVQRTVTQVVNRAQRTADQVTARVQRAAEGILENESLTAGLDDPAAGTLLDWGVACAERIAQSTAGLSDDEAEALMSPRLRATRRLMRHVKRWVSHRAEMEAEASAELLSEIIEQATIIYQDFTPPDDHRRGGFLRRWAAFADDTPQMIAHLRTFIEGSSDDPTSSSGGVHG